ncbi:MAG TPA: hypothetical protein VK388_04560 [Pyrinomonadaceae bacterium]|nr:hypothetical protein [Pyrinomonadaceae bacterium]
MNEQLAAAAELYRQLAFVSALIAGFSLTFLVQLLTAVSTRRVVNWTIGFSLAATASMIVCALGWTLSAAVVIDPRTQAELASRPSSLGLLHPRLSLTFIFGILFFLVGLGLCGWVRSRTMGIVSSTIALIAAAAAIMTLKLFIR